MTGPRIESALREQGADTLNNYSNDTAERSVKQRAKRLIFVAGVWGILSPGVTSWLIQRWGLTDA